MLAGPINAWISSLTSVGRTRPKSALVPQPKSNASVAAVASNRPVLADALCTSGARTTAAATAGRRAAGAIQSVGRLIWISFDPHHRKNDHARRFGIRIDIAAAAKRTMAVWKLDNDSHAPLHGHRGEAFCLPPISPCLQLRTGMVNGSLTEAALTSGNCAFCAG